jgi:hypothetical protein
VCETFGDLGGVAAASEIIPTADARVLTALRSKHRSAQRLGKMIPRYFTKQSQSSCLLIFI